MSSDFLSQSEVEKERKKQLQPKPKPVIHQKTEQERFDEYYKSLCTRFNRELISNDFPFEFEENDYDSENPSWKKFKRNCKKEFVVAESSYRNYFLECSLVKVLTIQGYKS